MARSCTDCWDRSKVARLVLGVFVDSGWRKRSYTSQDGRLIFRRVLSLDETWPGQEAQSSLAAVTALRMVKHLILFDTLGSQIVKEEKPKPS